MNNQAPSATVDEKCKTCNGTGNEICDNPDHGLIMSSIGARVQHHANGCPGCGNDDLYRIKGTVCPDCNGTGILHPQQPTVDVDALSKKIILTISQLVYVNIGDDKNLQNTVTDKVGELLQEALKGSYSIADMLNAWDTRNEYYQRTGNKDERSFLEWIIQYNTERNTK